MIQNVNFILIPHPIPELANHPVPLIGVLLLAAVVAIVDPLEGEVELEHGGDLRDEVDRVTLERIVADQLLGRLRECCIGGRLQKWEYKLKKILYYMFDTYFDGCDNQSLVLKALHRLRHHDINDLI